ncbi:outer membrane lipoprotein LolB [Massilia sp. DWR3-1-1]|uniref:outer membrane lipoprotein LolB n=1 Tax=Massilia sp. DWR3-1-1 TaxID=2804559 RepID=UPI003CE78614
MQRSSLIAAGLCAALLAGCASVAPSTGGAAAPVAAYRANFDAAGRLSVNYKHNGNPESLTGKFTWVQTPTRLDVTLSSPMATIATISVTPQSATLVQADKAPQVAADLESLTAASLGWTLPVSGLRDWLQGRATAADGSAFVASASASSVTTRDGWRLRFVSWQSDAAGHSIPRRIDAARDAALGAATEELAIRIVLDGPL